MHNENLMPTLNTFQLQVRDSDTIFGSQDLETLFEIPNYPVYMGCTDRKIEEDIFASQLWQISQSTGVLQLKYLVPLDLVYLEQHNDSYGKIWNEHHKRFSNLIPVLLAVELSKLEEQQENLLH